MTIPDNTKIPRIDTFGYTGKTQGFIKGAIKDNYFLYPEKLSKYFCKTIEEGVKSIDELLEKDEEFL